MPKLIPTRTRIADLGKPRVVIIGGGFGGLAVKSYDGTTITLSNGNTLISRMMIWAAGVTIGFKNKLFVLLSWIFSYFSYDKSNRLIIARPKDGVH